MDVKQTGRFISELRREKGLTQDELAAKLNVTNKAVSRWETGTGFPDVDSMMALSDFFGLSVNEILLGRRNPPPVREAGQGDSEELKKKEDAQIASDSLAISIRGRLHRKVIIGLTALLAAAAMLIAFLLIPRGTPRPYVGAAESERWFSPLSLCENNSLLPVPTAFLIDLKTGAVWTACSDPDCDHAPGNGNCIFNRFPDRTDVYAAVYLDNHIYFTASKETADGVKMKLYDHDMETGDIKEIYAYELVSSKVKLYSTHSLILFTTYEGSTKGQDIVSLRAYDPKSGSILFIDDYAGYTLIDNAVAFYDDYYICLDRYDTEKGSIVYCRRYYDGSRDEYFDTLPGGTMLEMNGYKLYSGLFLNANTGGVYSEDKGRFISLPADEPVTGVAAYSQKLYYQVKASDPLRTGNEVYAVSEYGGLKHYSIDCPYHFSIAAAYKNVILGRIDYEITENGGIKWYIGEQKLIRIELDTGKAQLYDVTRRSEYIYKTYVFDITLSEE